jgi:hypothetical protein
MTRRWRKAQQRSRPARKKNPTLHRRDPFYQLIGMGASGLTDGSVHHDRDMYGIRLKD